MSVKIILSNKVKNLFQYWNGTQKFSWSKLEYNYENMSSRSLMEIINLSQIEALN